MLRNGVMLPTPDTSHVDTSRIYEPAEDSFLLLDTLSSGTETAFLQTRLANAVSTPLVLEVGTGSGVVLAFLTSNARYIFGRDDILALGIDVNRQACQAAVGTVRIATTAAEGGAGWLLDVVQGDLLCSVRTASIDVLVFNPPYVPTSSLPDALAEEQDAFREESRLLELSYAGGDDGMAVTSRFLEQVPAMLSTCGVCYLLLCAQNKPARVIQSLEAGGLLEATIVGSSGKTGGWEKLCILRIMRRGG